MRNERNRVEGRGNHDDELEEELDRGSLRAGKVPVTARLMPSPEAAVHRAASTGGHALPGALRTQFESCLGTDLSGVRVHDGGESAVATDAVGAMAYATGQDIHFAAGQYDPSSPAGIHLLAHEVAHTVQQAGGSASARQHKLAVSEPGDALEVEADRAADAMVAGEQAVVSSGGVAVARRPHAAHPRASAGAAAATDRQKWQVFINRCAQANSYLESNYAAAEVFVRTCSANYNEGYNAHKKAIDAERARAQLTQDLILGVLFAAIGGSVGGGVGVAVGARVKDMLGAVAAGAVTDAAKDLAKYLARIPPRVSRGGSGGADANVTDTPANPEAAVGATGGARDSVAAIDPFTWSNTALLALAGERRDAFHLLEEMQDRANDAMGTQPYRADFDPIGVAKSACRVAGKSLRELGSLQIPSAMQYERGFWEAWLSQHAYTVGVIGGVRVAEEDVGRGLRREIDRVAAQFGESGDAWIQKYGGPARDKAEDTAREMNRIAPPGQHGPKY
jgi:hypothetical protein